MNPPPRPWWKRWRTLGMPPLSVVFHPAYRLPLTTLEARTGLGPRRSEFALWQLRAVGAIQTEIVAPRLPMADLLRVHTGRLVESLGDAEVLAHIFGVERWDVHVDALVDSILICAGGTVEAARRAMINNGPILNLQGGFHHAGPDVAAGFCPVNDIALAAMALWQDQPSLRIGILDLDAHPPDGTAACLAHDARVFIGSLSGSDWGPLDVDETVLPIGCDDDTYLDALHRLLRRAPKVDVWFVVAGGDVVAEDPLGQLGLTEGGVLRRDRTVAQALRGVPQVWLPGGGYLEPAWRRLAHTGLALAFRAPRPLPTQRDPLSWGFAGVSATLSPTALGIEDEPWLTEDDVAELFGPPARPPKYLQTYTPEGVLLALTRFGLLSHLERLGYSLFSVAIDRVSAGERLRVMAKAPALGESSATVLEQVVERTTSGAMGLALSAFPENTPILYVHWLTLRHPLAAARAGQPVLPGQDVPGLGLVREATELLRRTAVRIGCAAVVMRPSYFHVARAVHGSMRFVDPAREGQLQALLRDTAEMPLAAVTQAVTEGRVRCNDQPWMWEPAFMATWADSHQTWPPTDDDIVRQHLLSNEFSVSTSTA